MTKRRACEKYFQLIGGFHFWVKVPLTNPVLFSYIVVQWICNYF